MRTTPLHRFTRLKAKGPMRKVSAKQRAKRRTWAAVTAEAIAAVNGICQVAMYGCDVRATCCHHRRARSAGGKNVIENALPVCDYCHQILHLYPKWAQDRGFIVRSNHVSDN